MVCSCSVHFCFNHFKPGGRKISFFSFPLKNSERTQQWVNAVGRKGFIPTKHSKICSDHFNQNDFKQFNVGRKGRLKKEAVPSIFPNYSDILRSKMQCVNKYSIQRTKYRCNINTNKNESENVQCSDENCLMDVDSTKSVQIQSSSESPLSIGKDDSLALLPEPLLITGPDKRTKCFSTKAQIKNKLKIVAQQLRENEQLIQKLKNPSDLIGSF